MAVPRLPGEVWEEILLRHPPDSPASLLRASLVCKEWRRIVLRRGFRRRLAQLHGAPPMLGFFHNVMGRLCYAIGFVPTATSAFALPSDIPRRGDGESAWAAWHVLDCRHGRVLLYSPNSPELLVWEPLTGNRQLLPKPDREYLVGDFDPQDDIEDDMEEEELYEQPYGCNWAVMCAEDGCDHSDCHGRAFRIVVVSCGLEETEDAEGGDFTFFTSACVYSSRTGAWVKEAEIGALRGIIDNHKASVLAGNSLCFLNYCDYSGVGVEVDILVYDLQTRALTKIRVDDWKENIHIMQAEDGGLGFARAGDGEPVLELLSRDDEEEELVLRRSIHLKHVPDAAAKSATVVGFAQGANVIMLHTNDGIFTVELNSGRERKVPIKVKLNMRCDTYPLVGFYVPPRRPGDDAEESDDAGESDDVGGMTLKRAMMLKRAKI